MTKKRLAVVACAWAVVVGSAMGSQIGDIPLDAPNDAIMASQTDIQTVDHWIAGALLGNASSNSEPAFLEARLPFSFRYGGADSAALLTTWQRDVQITKEKDRRQYRITWTDPKTDLLVTAVVTGFSRYPAVEWVLYFENRGNQDTPILENVQALDTIVNTADATRSAVLHQLIGDDCNEHSFLPFETGLDAGKSITMAPQGGRPSNTTAFPFFNLQYDDQGVIAAIGWSGQWAASVERDSAGPTRLRAGMEKTHLVLHSGETIRSPRVLLMPWSGDRIAAHQRFRRLLMFHYVPRQAGRPLELPFVTCQCFDRYLGCDKMGSRPDWATEAQQIAAAKATSELGGSHHWLDAGWFPKGFPDGVGSWYCDAAKFPNGLKPVSEACHRLGVKFVLWFEPERVAGGSQIATEHPEFVFGGKNGGLFKLGDPAARRWLTDLLSNCISEFGVDVYRNDFNVDPLPFWRQNDTEDRQGMTEIRYVEGHYAMWDELIARHPGLWIDNCCSGGRRIDLETCMRSVPLWRSDTGCLPNHADWDQTQAQGLSLYVPLSTSCGWSPDAYDLRSSATGGAICQFDYLNPDFSYDNAYAALAEAKEDSKYWYGDFYPHTPASLATDQLITYQFHRADLNAGLVLVFRRKDCPQSSLIVRLGGVDPNAQYDVDFVDEKRQKTQRELSGRELAAGLELQLAEPRSSLAVRYRLAAQGTASK